MLDKNIILVVIFALLIIFYLVIRLGVGKKEQIKNSKQLTTYLGGVRILILMLGVVSFILWFFI